MIDEVDDEVEVIEIVLCVQMLDFDDILYQAIHQYNEHHDEIGMVVDHVDEHEVDEEQLNLEKDDEYEDVAIDEMADVE